MQGQRSSRRSVRLSQLPHRQSCSTPQPLVDEQRKLKLLLWTPEVTCTSPARLVEIYQQHRAHFSQNRRGELDGFVAKFSSHLQRLTIGVYRPSTLSFQLRNSNTAGPADINTSFGIAGDLPITGDWDGNGIDDVGIFRPGTGQFKLRGLFGLTVTMNFGQNGDLPVAGDWNGDGIDTVGVFRPATGEWFLTNGPNTNNTTPPVNFQFVFGQNGDLPIVGDWNGDGFDTPGVLRSGSSQFFLSNGFQGITDIGPFTFGSFGTKPVAGDWDGNGVATIGVFNPGTGTMSLNNTNTSGNGTGDLFSASD